MTGVLVCLSAAVFGVDFGWQPLADGGIEYVIQIEPQMLESLHDGQSLTSALPPAASQIRRYRIVVGTARLPHHGEPLPETPEEKSPEEKAAADPQQPDAREGARVGYEESLEREEPLGEASATGLSRMPIESPYPPDYEQAGMALPGPVLAPALLVHEEPQESEETQQDDAEIRIPDAAETRPPATVFAQQGQKVMERAETADDRRSREPPTIPTAEAPEEDLAPQLSFDGPAKKHDRSELKPEPPTGHAAAKPRITGRNEAAASDEPDSPSDAEPQAEAPAGKQNSLTLVGLFASLGGNVFLLWVAGGQRSRYRALLRRSREALAAASVAELPQAREEDDVPHWEAVDEEN